MLPAILAFNCRKGKKREKATTLFRSAAKGSVKQGRLDSEYSSHDSLAANCEIRSLFLVSTQVAIK